jgi:putative membrane protein
MKLKTSSSSLATDPMNLARGCPLPQDAPEKPIIKIDNSTRLAAERNRLALESTLMAWVRTAISIIPFGYGFYKASQLLHPDHPIQHGWLGSRQCGLIMILIAIMALILGIREHQTEAHQLCEDFGIRVSGSPARALAVTVALLGAAAVVSMLMRA